MSNNRLRIEIVESNLLGDTKKWTNAVVRNNYSRADISFDFSGTPVSSNDKELFFFVLNKWDYEDCSGNPVRETIKYALDNKRGIEMHYDYHDHDEVMEWYNEWQATQVT